MLLIFNEYMKYMNSQVRKGIIPYVINIFYYNYIYSFNHLILIVSKFGPRINFQNI